MSEIEIAIKQTEAEIEESLQILIGLKLDAMLECAVVLAKQVAFRDGLRYQLENKND